MAIFMQVPQIQGDVSATQHEHWIQLDRMHFYTQRHVKSKPGRIIDREGTRPDISQVLVSKHMDKSTPQLFTESCVGQAKDSVKIHLCTTGNILTPYMQYLLSNVIFCQYSVEILDDDHPVETLGISFDKIEMKFTPFNDKHKPESPIPAGYDLRAAEAL